MYRPVEWTVADMTTTKSSRRKSGKRPCSVCGRWYYPRPQTRHCQKTCGKPECRRAYRRRVQARWRARHPDYDAARRVRAAIEQTPEDKLVLRGPPRELRQLPIDLAQKALGVQGVIIIAVLSRLLWRGAQKALQAQVYEMTGDSDRLLGESAQKAMGRARPPP